MEWNVTEAKDKFSELLDRAETEGPQLVQRRGKRFVVLVETEEPEENRLVRAFLDEPEFRDLHLKKINAPVREPDL